MQEQVRIIQYGLGPIGSAVARHVVERPGLELVGCIDIDPAKVGRDAGEAIGLDHPLGFVVDRSLAQALERTRAEVAIHTTSSYFDLFEDQIVEILEAGLDVVSTAEELYFPWTGNARRAAKIDAVATESI